MTDTVTGLGVLIEATAITMRITAEGEEKSRAWVTLRQDGPADWLLTGIDVSREFERQGYGRALLESVRRWAGSNGLTVRTSGAMPDVYGFYEQTGCSQVVDSEGDVEYVVAPIEGA